MEGFKDLSPDAKVRYRKMIEQHNADKIKNNQKILYDWFYKDQDFKLDIIKWMFEDDNRQIKK